MSWKSHILRIYEKANRRLNILKSLKFKINRSTLICLYKSLIRPLMEYGDVIWDNCSEGESQLLESVQYESARVVTRAIKGTSGRRLRDELAWEELSERRKLNKLIHFYKIAKRLVPMYLIGLFPPTQGEYSRFSLRSADNFIQLQCRIVRYQESFFPSSIKIWNNLSLDLRNSISLLTFKAKLQFYIFPHTYNKLFDYSISRQASILHTRLRLGYCALNDYLFKINCSLSPKCRCGLANETVKHFFLFCPLFAAQRARLFTSAAQIYGDH